MNEQGFNERVRALESRMYHTARTMLRCDADCADALQNAVFAAWRRLPSLRNEDCFDAWLMRILVNCCRDIQRTYQRQSSEVMLDENLPFREEPPDMALYDALERLPEKYRLPVVMHHLDGFPIKEVAKVLLLPQATIKWRIHEGIQRLRIQLKEDIQP